jgi:hypothetical protein
VCRVAWSFSLCSDTRNIYVSNHVLVKRGGHTLRVYVIRHTVYGQRAWPTINPQNKEKPRNGWAAGLGWRLNAAGIVPIVPIAVETRDPFREWFPRYAANPAARLACVEYVPKLHCINSLSIARARRLARSLARISPPAHSSRATTRRRSTSRARAAGVGV